MKVSGASFAVFVYPFSFDRRRWVDLVRSAESDTLAESDSQWNVWKTRSFPADDLLRHVAEYLNPPPGVPAAARIWSMDERVIASPRGLGFRPGAVSLLLRHRAGLKSEASDSNNVNGGALPLHISGVDFALFRGGMGYLLFSVRPRSDLPEDWYDFLNGFRYIDRLTQVALTFRRRVSKQRTEPFFPPLADCPDCSESGRGSVGHLIRGILRRLAPGDVSWWQEIFVPAQVIPFYALFFEEAAKEEQPLILYRLRNFFRAGQELVPSEYDLRYDPKNLLPYAERMWFLSTLEGGGFVAFDAPETAFWSQTMPSHLREQYLLLFVLALNQRFTLMHLSNQVSANWLGSGATEAEERFSELREGLLEFTARGYFHQVMQRDHHHRCFRAWRTVFETERLYEEVKEEVRELHGILLMRKTERIQLLAEEQRRSMHVAEQLSAEREEAAQKRAGRISGWLGGIAFLLGFPSLVLGFLGVIGQSDFWIAVGSLGSAVALGAVLMLIAHSVLREPSHAAVERQDPPDGEGAARDAAAYPDTGPPAP